jgi:hypothetical protein
MFINCSVSNDNIVSNILENYIGCYILSICRATEFERQYDQLQKLQTCSHLISDLIRT